MTSFPSSAKTWTALVDGLDQAKAADVNTAYDEITAIENELMQNLFRAGYSYNLTMSNDLTLTDSHKAILYLNPNGSDRIVTLPAGAAGNHAFIITNTAGAANTLTVKTVASETIGTVAQNEAKFFVSNGTVWRQLTTGSAGSGGGDVLEVQVFS